MVTDHPHPWATIGCGTCGEYTWYDPELAVGHAPGKYLPHVRRPGAVYFVTMRTADSMPAAVLGAWAEQRELWLTQHPLPHDQNTRGEFSRLFTRRMHRLLDESHGRCPFRDPSARAVIETVLRNRDSVDYALDWYVIMPNHVHALVSPKGDMELSDVGSTWKAVTAHRLNKLLNRRGEFWQQESWDHAVRRPEHLERYRRYVAENPAFLPRA
jgi:REP element-mobilizing transposase RayT